MFLLFPISSANTAKTNLHLHSNMFLLFLTLLASLPKGSLQFTFQYVSIISSLSENLLCGMADLHSNMFLLFPSPLEAVVIVIIRFTFQYVSIISKMPLMSSASVVIYIPICFYYFKLILVSIDQ